MALDDSTLNETYAKQIALMYWQWSGKHQGVVRGINLISLVWIDGDRYVPVDFSAQDKTVGRAQDDPFNPG